MRPLGGKGSPYRVSTDVRRVGALLRVPAFNPSLPDRCVVCNAPATERVQRTLHRITRPDSTVMFVAILLLCLPALLWLKPVNVDFGLCPRHLRRVRIMAAAAWLGAGLFFVGGFVAANFGLGWLAVASLAASVVVTIYAPRRWTILRIREREGDYVLLSAPAAFLESFDELRP